MAKYIELRPNSKLIDPNFDCYKLSLDPIPMFSMQLLAPVYRILPNDQQYSLLHAKLFALHNHLIYDFWNDDDNIYFIDKNWSVQKCSIELHINEIKINKIWDIPNHNSNFTGHYNMTMMFLSKTLAVISDGIQTLYVIDTGNRDVIENWKTMFSEKILRETSFVIVDVRSEFNDDDDCISINCVLMYIKKNEILKTHVTALKWITINGNKDGNWKIVDTKFLEGKGELHYCALEIGSKAIYIGSDNKFNFIDEKVRDDPLGKDIQNKYSWQQTENDITLTLNIDKNQNKNDFKVDSTVADLKIHHENKILIYIKLWNFINPDITTWNIDIEDKLCVVLIKRDKSVWPKLVSNDMPKDEQLEDANKELEEKSEPVAPSFNSQQLEECDMAPEESATLERLCGISKKATHCAGLETHQVLFTLRIKADEHPILALRHDVDGCLWQPEPATNDNWKINHIGTLCAFGYIQASKEQKKFEICSPDFSYSVISESNRHLFIYRQSRPVTEGCQLRNRISARNIGTYAQQQVINLIDGEVLGIHASCQALFILTENKLSIFKI